jgi:hypothetical protein
MIGLVSVPGGAQEKEQEPDPVYVFGTTVVIPSGLKGIVYYISRSTKNLEDLEKEKPRGAIYTSSLNVPPQDYKAGFPGIAKRLEWFGIDYTGRFWIDKPGEYRFELTSDDGSLLYIDGQLVIDNWGMHPATTLAGKVPLNAGVHTIRVPYFQGPKFLVALVLKIAGPGEKLRVFSTDEFKPPANPDVPVFPETTAPAK